MTAVRTRNAEGEVAILRASLLGGCGRGASEAEVLANTRDLQWLGAAPTSRELERVARQTARARIGATFNSFSRIGRIAKRFARIAAVGVAALLILRATTLTPGAATRRQRRKPRQNS